MNEFVEQFLVECRELIAEATAALLGLEQQIDDPDRFDSVFRAFHTLKGAAGIVEFESMSRALHAAESVLAGFRSSSNVISPAIIDECLACLDQVSRWLDEMEASGETPSDAGPAADAIVRQFAVSTARQVVPAGASPAADWLARLRDRNLGRFSEARTALRYIPDAEAFFQGGDPLGLVESLPGLIAIDLKPRAPAQVFAALNPFICAVDITALTSADAETIRGVVGHVADRIEVCVLDIEGRAEFGPTLSPTARSILAAQVLLLREPERGGYAGRAASAGRVSINVLRSIGFASAAASVESVLKGWDTKSGSDELIAAIVHALGTEERDSGVAPGPTAPISSPAAARNLRVDTGRIDTLVNLTGELTVVKNALGHLATLAQGGLDAKKIASSLRDHQALLDRLVGEVQRAVLRIRVLPLRQVFQRLPRLVREISTRVGKSVKFDIEGDGTEADTAVVESLFEPLLHVLRNAVDHGIEDPEQRAVTGKPATATIVLRASRQLDNVIVEVEDDGRGIDVTRVREVAAARGVATADALMAMADTEVVDLIFAPGFSTAREVTGLSGRGVGMDAVRAAVERLGGRVSIDTQPNVGTVVRLILPFTVMMTRVMTIEAAGQVFGLPLDMVVETAILDRNRIVPIGAATAFAWRDKTVPLISLAESLGLSSHMPKTGQARIVVTSAGGQFGAVEVDRLGERMDVMLKPMNGLLGGMKGVAGTTLLGDGRVLIVLDVQELFN
jgi:two-component system, chemotaxis family, sensor kinase CheA